MKKNLYLKLILAVLTLFYVNGIVQAQNTPIPIDKRVKIGTLPNGLTYYICKNAKPEKRVELRLVVKAGAVQENADQQGMAHFVEHMSFNGTSHFPKNELIHYLQSVGVGFGEGVNAYTNFDETVYMLTVPSDSIKVLNKGLLVLEDWANNVTFDSTEIYKERRVVLEEWRLGLGAYRRMQNKYIPVLLKDSKYADHLIIGTEESILNTPAENIKSFYKDWYRPDIMALVIVGDIDPDQIEQKIQKDFAKLKSPATEKPIGIYKIADNDKPLTCVVSDKENTNTRIILAYKTQTASKITLDDFRQSIIREMFCSLLNQRLNELTKKSDPPIVGAWSYYGNLWVKSREAFQISITVKEDASLKGMNAVLTETERVKRFGYTQPELDRIKKEFLKYAETSYNEREKQESGNVVWRYVSHFLSNDPIPGSEFYYDYLKKNLDKILLDDVNKLAKEWLTDKNEVAIVMGIDKEGVKLPTDKDLVTSFEWVKTLALEPYKENIIASSLMTTKPKAGKVLSEKLIPNTGITEWTLSNGIKVILKPTDFKNDEIQMQAYCNGGSSLFGPEYKLSAQFSSQIISASGVGTFSKIDLDKFMTGKNASVYPYISDIKSGVHAGSSVADFENMLQLNYLYFTAPRRDTTAYNSTYSRFSSMYKNVMSNPTSYFFNQVQLKRYGNNQDAPGMFPVEKDWNQMSLDKAMEVYKRNFSNSSNYTFMLVGNFKPEQIKPLIETYLASLPSTKKKGTFVDKGFRPNKGPVSDIIYKGTDPKTFVYLAIDGPTKWSKKDAHAIFSLGNILQRVLTDKLREEMSGVYGFGIQATVEKFPYEYFSFNITLPCAPENADKLTKAAIVEIERMKTTGPTPEEMSKELETQRRTQETNNKDNNWWMFCLNRISSEEIEFGRVQKPFELCEMVTPELMKETAKKYLDTSKIVRYTLYPENYKKDSASK